MGVGGSTSSRLSGDPTVGEALTNQGAIEPPWPLPEACHDEAWSQVKLSSIVGIEAGGLEGVPDFAAETGIRSSDNAGHDGKLDSSRLAAACFDSESGDCDQLEESLCLSMSSLRDSEMASLVTQAKGDLLRRLSLLCQSGDTFHQAVRKRVHALNCVHAAMTRRRASQGDHAAATNRKYRPSVKRQEDTSVGGVCGGVPASSDALLGLHLFLSMLDFVRDPECTQEQRYDFLHQIVPVLSSLPPSCLSQEYPESGCDECGECPNQQPEGVAISTPSVVQALREFLVDCIYQSCTHQSCTHVGIQCKRGGASNCGHATQSCLFKLEQGDAALSALVSLVAARGRACDLLLLVKVLLRGHIEASAPCRGRSGRQESPAENLEGAEGTNGGAEARKPHIVVECAAKR